MLNKKTIELLTENELLLVAGGLNWVKKEEEKPIVLSCPRLSEELCK